MVREETPRNALLRRFQRNGPLLGGRSLPAAAGRRRGLGESRAAQVTPSTPGMQPDTPENKYPPRVLSVGNVGDSDRCPGHCLGLPKDVVFWEDAFGLVGFHSVGHFVSIPNYFKSIPLNYGEERCGAAEVSIACDVECI